MAHFSVLLFAEKNIKRKTYDSLYSIFETQDFF